MKKIFFLLTLAFAVFDAPAHATGVRIGVLSLFRPQELVLIYQGEAPAYLMINDEPDLRQIVLKGMSIRIRAARDGLWLVLQDNTVILDENAHVHRLALVADSQPDYLFDLVIPEKIRRAFAGRFSVTCAKHRLHPVVELALEDAVAACVASEMATVKELEALKAQAVVSRSYLLAHMGRHRDQGFDFCDTTHCQFFKGLSGVRENDNYRAAVQATEGLILTYQGTAIAPYYTAVCGGRTVVPNKIWKEEKSSYPFFPVRCAYCRRAEHFTWERRYNKRRLLSKLSSGSSVPYSIDAEILRVVTSENLPDRITIKDKNHARSFTVETFRVLVGRAVGWDVVLSNRFAIETRGDELVFKGYGRGHLVGFCQQGAIEQAKRNKTFQEILDFYFPLVDF